MESAVCWFLVREENRRTRRKTLEAEKRTNTNSSHLWRRVRESNPGHIGGRRVLSPLRHPCFPKEGTMRSTKTNKGLYPFSETNFQDSSRTQNDSSRNQKLKLKALSKTRSPFPVLENATVKFQDFPGFPGPVRTMIKA